MSLLGLLRQLPNLPNLNESPLVQALTGSGSKAPQNNGFASLAPQLVSAVPPEYASKGIGQQSWDRMNSGDVNAPLPELSGEGLVKPLDLEQPVAPDKGGLAASTIKKPLVDITQTPVKPETRSALPPDSPPNWPSIRAGIFKGESGGDYDKLFANSEKGPFSGTKLTNMTVDQAIDFAAPSGPYGQWVKQKIGRVATPMGAYQIVGSTLRSVKQGMGLTGNERMTPELQERMGLYIYKTGGTGQWEGYRGPADPNSVKTSASGVVASPAYGPTSNEMTRPSGSQSAIPAINAPTSGFSMEPGDYNTALNNPKNSRRGGGGGGASKGGTGPDSGGGGGGRKNEVSPDYKRYQARKNIRHLRGMSPVATIQALENIGKGLRTQGGGKA